MAKPLILLLFLALAGYGQLLVPGTIPYSRHSDILAGHLATKSVLHQSLARGEGIPFWRSDQFSGYPALTNPQALFTHPLHLAFLLVSPYQAVGLTLWLHFLLAGLGFYLLGKALELPPAACLLMALSGLFSFKLAIAAYAGWLSVLSSIVLLPFFFAALVHALSGRLWGMLGLAVTIGLGLTSGQLQLFYYGGLFALLGVTLRLIHLRHETGELSPRRLLLLLGASACLGVGLAAYLLVPLALDAPLLSRSGGSYEFFIGNHSLSWKHLWTFLNPELLGSPLDDSYPGVELWEDVAYFGLIPLLLALYALIMDHRRSLVRLLGGGLLLSLLLSLDSPLSKLAFQVLPGFALFRHPSRFLFLASLFGIVLGGIGFELMQQKLQAKGVRGRALLIATILPLAVISVEGILTARRYLQVRNLGETKFEPSFARRLRQEPRPFRVAPLKRLTVNPAQLAPLGIELLSGFDSTNFKHYQRYLGLLETGRLQPTRPRSWLELEGVKRIDLLNLLDVRFVVSPVRLHSMPPEFSLVGKFADQPLFVLTQGMVTRDIYLYRNAGEARRVRYADQVLRVDSAAKMDEATARHGLGKLAIVLGGKARTSTPSRVARTATVVVSRPGHLVVDARAPAGGFLLVSEIWHPGWRATIDGSSAPLRRANIALMGIDLGSGRHTVELVFEPSGWMSGLTITLISLGVFALLSLLLLWRQRAAPSRTSPDV